MVGLSMPNPTVVRHFPEGPTYSRAPERLIGLGSLSKMECISTSIVDDHHSALNWKSFNSTIRARLTAHIYEKCRRPKATKKAKTKTSKISKTSVFHRFFIFEVLVSFPQVEMGRKPKPPISKTSQKPL